MCGIVGTLVFDGGGFTVTEPYLVGMRDTMVHRGPDDDGLWIGEGGRVGLGFRRLSIIDLSPEAGQPMSNEDGTLWVCFNGEIYNHAEIRGELERAGTHRWRTDHSDTEVILHAFEEWGIGCLERFRGMFAMALWDGLRRELWLVRDRIGIKPLYYSLHHGRIAFASEIKALLRDPEQAREVNAEAFYHYLSFLVSPPPQTMFQGIRKLLPGTWMRVRMNGQVQERRYWDVWDHTKPLTDLSDEEIAHQILEELRVSVRLRKVSDVPVGVFLSGGIDSSTNAALFSEGERHPVKTFTIGYDRNYGTYQNELHYARLMAATVKADHHERVLDLSDLIDFLPRMVYLQDEPLGDPVCMPLYYVSKLARDHGVIVCQVGEGADELFGGYTTWKRALRLQELDGLPVPRGLKAIGLAGLRLAGKRKTPYYEWLRRGSEGQPIFWGGTDAVSEGQKQSLISPRLRREFRGLSSWEVLEPIHARFREKAWEQSALNWMSYVDLNLRLPELMLMRVDKMSMGVSLEGRVPFLDHRFVELAMSIPESVKLRNGELKGILKKAVRGLIPDELIDRRKQGFHVPVFEWFFDRLGEKIRRDLAEFCEHTDLLDRAEVARVLEQGRGMTAWYLLNVALWWKEFFR